MRDNEECFRVRGIPHAFDKAETEKHVRRALSLGADVKMRIRSLAPEPYPPGEQMATVDFDARPGCLSRDNCTDEWNVFCDCGICIASDSGCAFTIDSHFRDIRAFHWPDHEEWEMDVIAIPGLGGHAFGSFKSRGATEMWLRDFIPRQLPGARIFTYGYDSHLVGSESFQSIRDLAMKFRRAIERIRTHPHKFDVRKPIVFIGHSFGGIILKEAILRMTDAEVQDMKILGSIAGILFFGVPNHGMDIKSLLPMVHDQPNEVLVHSLHQDSDSLISQSEQFSKQFKGKGQGVNFNKIKIFSFYETKRSPTAQMTDGIWKMDGPPTVLVGKSSATHGRPWETDNNFVRPIDRAHSELVKFASRHDEDYRDVLYLLRDLTNDEKNPPPYRLSKKEKECLCSLAFTEQDSRLQAILTTEDTSAWFAKHSSYKRWLDLDNQTALLSIVGHPGVGKSTLMKYAFKHTEEQFAGRAIVLSHFFDGKAKESSMSTKSIFPNFGPFWRGAKEDSNLARSSLGLYRNLLNQLLSARPTLLSHRAPESILSVFENKQSTRGKAWKDWRWQEEELHRFLQAVLTEAALVAPVFVFIDALDECDGFNTAKAIVKYFSDLCTTTSTLHLCVSYRKHLDPMPANVVNLQICVEEEEGHDTAIREVVEQILQEIQDDEKRTKTQTAIINGADSIFLWAILVSTKAVEMADAGDSTKAIERMTEGVPGKLDSLFQELLSKVTKSKLRQTIKLFQWICFARRPLSLEELQFALAIDPDLGEMPVDELRKMSGFRENLDDVRRAVKALSQGLADIVHTDGKDTVQLIHHTVYLYLVQIGLNTLETSHCTDTARTCISRSSAFCRGHAQIARICITCTRIPLKDCAGAFPAVCVVPDRVESPSNQKTHHCFGVRLPNRQDWITIDQYLPLLAYAVSSANYHAEKALGRFGGFNMIPHVSFFLFEFRSLALIASWNRVFNLVMFDAAPHSVSAVLTYFPSVRICGNVNDCKWWTRPQDMRIRKMVQSYLEPPRPKCKLTTLALRALHQVWIDVYRLTKLNRDDDSAVCVIIVIPNPRGVFLIFIYSYLALMQVGLFPTILNILMPEFFTCNSFIALILFYSYPSFIIFYLLLYMFWWKILTQKSSSRLLIIFGEKNYCRTTIFRSYALLLFYFLIVWDLQNRQFWDLEKVCIKLFLMPLCKVFHVSAWLLVLSCMFGWPDEPCDRANGSPINSLSGSTCIMVIASAVVDKNLRYLPINILRISFRILRYIVLSLGGRN